MEDTYRRQYSCSRRGVKPRDKQMMANIKLYLVKQSILCAIIFVGVSVIQTSTDGKFDFAKESIKYILSETTDYNAVMSGGKKFVDEYVLQKEPESVISELEPVSAMIAPLEHSIMTSGFGSRMHPTEGVEKFHYGVDLSAEKGEKIKCISDGLAIDVGIDADYGNYILVKHSEKIASFYAHCDQIIATKGDQIKAGQVIATVGETGNSTGAHLHLEIRENENFLNPEDYIKFTQTTNVE